MCPLLLLHHVRQSHTSSIFTASSANTDIWLPRHQDRANNSAESFRGLLGYSSAPQMKFFERCFENIGDPGPRSSVISPLWAALDNNCGGAVVEYFQFLYSLPPIPSPFTSRPIVEALRPSPPKLRRIPTKRTTTPTETRKA